MTLRGALNVTATALLNGLLGVVIGALLGAVRVYVVPLPWVKNDPHAWYWIAVLAFVCGVLGVVSTFRDPARRRSADRDVER